MRWNSALWQVLVTAVACGMAAAPQGMTVVAQGPFTLDNLLGGGDPVAPKPLVKPAELRRPIPSPEDLATAIELIRQAYEEDYAAAEAAPRRLIDRLLDTADEVEDPARQYALLVEGERLAIECGELEPAIEASSLRSRRFEVSPAEARLQVLLAAGKSDRRDDAAVFRLLIDLADQVLEGGDVDFADKAAAEALAVAKRVERQERLAAAAERKKTGRKPDGGGDAPVFIEQAIGMLRRVKDRRRAIAEYEVALADLLDKPEDAAANGVVGRYQCFVKREWREGLKSLMMGDAEALRSVAEDELLLLEEERPTPQRLLAVAGAWWKIAEGQRWKTPEVVAMKQHAAELYKRVLPNVDDPIELALVKKRIASVKTEADDEGGSPEASRTNRPGASRRRDATLRVPASVFLTAPADLSPHLVPLLPTQAEVAALQNRVNIPDTEVRRAKDAFLERVYAGFSVERWTTVDAVYVIELTDRLNILIGSASARLPRGSISGSREACKAAIASEWLQKSKSEHDFAARIRSLPADTLSQLDRMLDEREAKEWLLQLGPEYASARRKLQAIEYLIQQGVASQGMRRYGEELANTAAAQR